MSASNSENEENQATNESTEDHIFLPPAQARKTLRVTAATLRAWDKSGKLHTERMPSGYRFYRIPTRMLDSQTRDQYSIEHHHRRQQRKTENKHQQTIPSSIPSESNISTPESLHPNKRKAVISKNKSKRSKNNTQITKLSQTVPLESTGNDLHLKPYWNYRTKTWSKKLWSHTGTDCADLRLSYSNTSSNSIIHKSKWSTHQQRTPIISSLSLMNSHKTSWQLTRSSSANNSPTALQKIVEKENNNVKLNCKERKWMKTAQRRIHKRNQFQSLPLSVQTPSVNPEYQSTKYQQDQQYPFLWRTLTRINRKSPSLVSLCQKQLHSLPLKEYLNLLCRLQLARPTFPSQILVDIITQQTPSSPNYLEEESNSDTDEIEWECIRCHQHNLIEVLLRSVVEIELPFSHVPISIKSEITHYQ